MQCWTQASKPEPLKQETQKEKTKKLYSILLNKFRYIQKDNLNENTN